MEAIARRGNDGKDDPGAVPGVLASVAQVACRVAGVDEAVILLLDQVSPGSLVAVARHPQQGSDAVAAWPAGEGVARRALASGQAAAEGREGDRVRAAAPLVVDGRARGVLLVSAGTVGRRYGRDQLELLSDLAGIASSWVIEREPRRRSASLVAAGAEVLARAVDMRDDYMGHHSAQVGDLARRIGDRLEMPAPEIDLLECAARLHDVGKLGVPDAILQKPGPLEEDEWAVMRSHPDWGAEMVARVPGLEEIAPLVRGHHERWDGGGYPDGLAGAGIPLASRVIAACDAFEAMVSRRPYRPALDIDAALAELDAGAGKQFDPAVVAALQVELA